MNKKYLLILFFIGFSFNGFSQFEIKAFLGLNGASYSGLTNSESQNAGLGFQGGAAILFGTTWYFEPGVVWYTNGTDLNILKDSIISGENIISGFKVPLMVGYRFFGRTQNLLNLRLFVGATANFVSKVKIGEIELNKDLYNSVNWDANFGVGLDVWFLFLELGYELGLSDIYTGSISLKQNAIYANLGFRMKFGNKSRGRSKN